MVDDFFFKIVWWKCELTCVQKCSDTCSKSLGNFINRLMKFWKPIDIYKVCEYPSVRHHNGLLHDSPWELWAWIFFKIISWPACRTHSFHYKSCDHFVQLDDVENFRTINGVSNTVNLDHCNFKMAHDSNQIWAFLTGASLESQGNNQLRTDVWMFLGQGKFFYFSATEGEEISNWIVCVCMQQTNSLTISQY